MLRNGGEIALRRVLLGIGKVERPQRHGKLCTINQPIHCAAPHGRLGEEWNRGTASVQIKLSRYRENTVAEGFKIHPLSIHAPEQTVLRVGISKGRVVR